MRDWERIDVHDLEREKLRELKREKERELERNLRRLEKEREKVKETRVQIQAAAALDVLYGRDLGGFVEEY